MLENLVSEKIIISNLRRTASKGLLSSLSRVQLHYLSLKYFGIYENDQLIGYQCPYSGEILTSSETIVLEHIIPVSSGGGTTLFNCIPVSEKVNKNSEKGTKHLISWWVNSKYWDNHALERLEKIIQYILEAYYIMNNKINDNYNFIDVLESNDDYEVILENQKSNLSTTQIEEQKNKNSIPITYYEIINDLIKELGNHTDSSFYQSQLQILINKNIFKNIDKQTLIQNILKVIIKNRLELEDRSELTFVLNINISLLSRALENLSDNEIYNELEKRIENIEFLLKSNKVSLYSFFTDKKSLIYLYKDSKSLTEEDAQKLIRNINMCVEDKFNAMIEFFINNNGLLPNQHSDNKKEAELGRFRNNIQQIENNKGTFYVSLTKKQLEYLCNSKDKILNEIYKTILNKAIENDIEIAYVDEQMKIRILEFQEKTKHVSLDEQIRLENEYSDVIISKSQFNQFISYVLENNGILPSVESTDEEERKLGGFRSNIQSIQKNIGKFVVTLTGEQLKYLHNSNHKTLNEIYKTILNKAIENKIEIAYVDEQMKTRILEFQEKTKHVSLEEQIRLESEYSDVIIPKSQFNQFISYVLENNGILPSTKSKSEKEKKLGSFRNSIQNVRKKICKFATMLTEDQLKYLHNSKYESLNEIYKTILNKAIENNIEIAYVDEQMKTRILEFHQKNNQVSLEEQIRLESEYSDVIIPKSQFNQFISYVLENNGFLPSVESTDEEERKIGRFRNDIQMLRSNKESFKIKLTKEQLEYLYNSECFSLTEIYNNIIQKATIINYQPYIEINNQLMINKKGKVA